MTRSMKCFRFACKGWPWGLLALQLLGAPAATADAPIMPAAKVSVAVHETRSRTLYVDVALPRVGISRFLLDTGAGYSVITTAMLEELLRHGLAVFERNLVGILADESRQVVPLYRVSSLRIGASCVVRDVQVAVFEGVRRGVVGLNVLRRTAPFTISVEPLVLELSRCEGVSAELASSM